MSVRPLMPSELRRCVRPESLGFADTSELENDTLSWIGQERAESATRFGMSMTQPDYNLFVLGEEGCGRSSLLQKAMQLAAANRPAPPDLCYLHNFHAPGRPLALRLPAGQGQIFRQCMVNFCKSLQRDIPKRLAQDDFKVESHRLEQVYKVQLDQAYDALDSFAEARHFSLMREDGLLAIRLREPKGRAYTEQQAVELPKERRAAINEAKLELEGEVRRFLEQVRPLEHDLNEALSELRKVTVRPLLQEAIQLISQEFGQGQPRLKNCLHQVVEDVLECLPLFQVVSVEDEPARAESLLAVMARYQVNVVVDNSTLRTAPVIVENNPCYRALFGSMEHQPQGDGLVTDFSCIRAGSLMRAHGGYLMLHLSDLLVDDMVWAKLRRFLRDQRLQIEDAGLALSPVATMTLEPEAVDLEVKLVLIGSPEDYYSLQELDPEMGRRFRTKVDFAPSFVPTAQTNTAMGVFVAHTCTRWGLAHFSAAAVARLMEQLHRATDDQQYQSAVFSQTEAWIVESAAACKDRNGLRVEAIDVEAALRSGQRRHDYMEQSLTESIARGEYLLSCTGSRVGQINALTHVDLGDYRFGFPVRVSARTYAGEEGVLSIEREVEMSGPIHSKGVLILKSFLGATFAHVGPLAMDASIVFEQEYQWVDGDSASCAELFALLSSLSQLPLQQCIAVTGAINQHGDVLPIGGVNEKIEAFFRLCKASGLDGTHGVLIPMHNRQHLMLDSTVIEAVAAGSFHIHAVERFDQALELLMGLPAGKILVRGGYAKRSVLGRVQESLVAYRRACKNVEPHTRLHSRSH